jgi:hypothetical protein
MGCSTGTILRHMNTVTPEIQRTTSADFSLATLSLN